MVRVSINFIFQISDGKKYEAAMTTEMPPAKARRRSPKSEVRERGCGSRLEPHRIGKREQNRVSLANFVCVEAIMYVYVYVYII